MSREPELIAELNRARVQEEILSTTVMVTSAQACQLLGLPASNPLETMRRKEQGQGVFRLTVNGRAAYPLFQFDVEARTIFPALCDIMALKPSRWSDVRLLHWLNSSHLDFGGPPARVLGTDGPAVVAAFIRNIAPLLHG